MNKTLKMQLLKTNLHLLFEHFLALRHVSPTPSQLQRKKKLVRESKKKKILKKM